MKIMFVYYIIYYNKQILNTRSASAPVTTCYYLNQSDQIQEPLGGTGLHVDISPIDINLQ